MTRRLFRLVSPSTTAVAPRAMVFSPRLIVCMSTRIICPVSIILHVLCKPIPCAPPDTFDYTSSPAQCRVHKRACSKKEMGPQARHWGYCLLLVSLFSPSITLCFSCLYTMPNTTSPKLRSGFVISLDACLRYLGSFKGHGFSFANVRPSNSRTRNLLKKEMCDEERSMEAREDLESAQIERVHDYFRHLRRKAPEELRVRLVLPHSERWHLFNSFDLQSFSCGISAFIHIVKHEKFGERHKTCLYLPTGTANSVEDSGPTNLDCKRLRIFLETTSSLLGESADYNAAKFTPFDFTFSTIPAIALFEPIFSAEELKVCYGSSWRKLVRFAAAYVHSSFLRRRNLRRRGVELSSSMGFRSVNF